MMNTMTACPECGTQAMDDTERRYQGCCADCYRNVVRCCVRLDVEFQQSGSEWSERY